MYYTQCPHCSANLDPGEKCDCQLVDAMQKLSGPAQQEVIDPITDLSIKEQALIQAYRTADDASRTLVGFLLEEYGLAAIEEGRPPAATSEASTNAANGHESHLHATTAGGTMQGRE